MQHPTRPNNSRQHRLVTVRGAGGATRRIEARRSDLSVEVRAEGDAPGFDGYASTFWVVDAYGTAIAPGAFTKTLQERADKQLVLWQHNPDWPIGKPTELRQDDTGLWVSDAISDVSYGRDCMTLLRDGVPLGLSIGFQTMRERAATDADPLRFGDMTPQWARNNPEWIYVLEELKLYEHSPVSFAANDEAAPTVVRDGTTDGLLAAALLEDLRAGRLDPAERALAAEIAAALTAAAPESRQAPPRTAEEERADREFLMRFWAEQHGLSVEQMLCAH